MRIKTFLLAVAAAIGLGLPAFADQPVVWTMTFAQTSIPVTPALNVPTNLAFGSVIWTNASQPGGAIQSNYLDCVLQSQVSVQFAVNQTCAAGLSGAGSQINNQFKLNSLVSPDAVAWSPGPSILLTNINAFTGLGDGTGLGTNTWAGVNTNWDAKSFRYLMFTNVTTWTTNNFVTNLPAYLAIKVMFKGG